MTLATELMGVEMTLTCPYCGFANIRNGIGFRCIQHLVCGGCSLPIRMNYNDKLALFDRYGRQG